MASTQSSTRNAAAAKTVAAKTVAARTVAAKTAEDRLEALREQFDELELRDRLEDALEDARERVPELLEDLEPAARQAQIRGWQLLRQLIGVLLVLPRVLVRVLGALPGVIAGAQRLAAGAEKQGGELAGRAKEVAGSVPTVKRLRRRRRTQLAVWTAGGFTAGVLTGWLLARRRRPDVAYEATQGSTDEVTVPSVNGAAPVTSDAAVRE